MNTFYLLALLPFLQIISAASQPTCAARDLALGCQPVAQPPTSDYGAYPTGDYATGDYGGPAPAPVCNGGRIFCFNKAFCCCPEGQDICCGKCTERKSKCQVCNYKTCKIECPAGKEFCGQGCKPKVVEGATCCKDGTLCCEAEKGLIQCNNKCFKKIEGASCTKTYECPCGTKECNGKCVKFCEGQILDAKTCVASCPKETELCGNKCEKIQADKKCGVWKCEKPGYEVCGDKCQLKYKGQICCPNQKSWVCPSGTALCDKECKKCIIGAECDGKENVCKKGFVDCGGECVMERKNARCSPCDRKYKCLDAFVECNGECVQRLQGGECSPPYGCPKGKVNCKGICYDAIEGAECGPAGPKCKDDQMICGKKCVPKWKNCQCINDKPQCIQGTELCGMNCAQKPSGPCTCDKGKEEWVCNAGYIRCGCSCLKAIANAKCGQGGLVCTEGYEMCGESCYKKCTGMKCNNGKYECEAGLTLCGDSCSKQPANSRCCSVTKKWVCLDGTRRCPEKDGDCKRYIEGATCGKGGWECADKKRECSGKCVDGPEGCNCCDGKCKCKPGQLECDGKCQDVSPSHCGKCGQTCKGNFKACSLEQRQCVCTAGKKMCGEDCVCTFSNPNHCGKCGNKCPAGGYCQGGTCQTPDYPVY